jgi:hypothetical protein
VLTIPAFCQESRATITGTVSDPQGAVVPGAKVEVRNLETSAVTAVATSDRGLYSIPGLNPGQCSVTVTAAGFRTVVRANIELRVAERRQLDV